METDNLNEQQRPRKCCITVPHCSVKGCGTTKSKNVGLSFHCFPKRFYRAKYDNGQQVEIDYWREWKSRCQIDRLTNSTKICSLHFSEDDFVISHGKQILKADAIPHLNLPCNSLHQEKFSMTDSQILTERITASQSPTWSTPPLKEEPITEDLTTPEDLQCDEIAYSLERLIENMSYGPMISIDHLPASTFESPTSTGPAQLFQPEQDLPSSPDSSEFSEIHSPSAIHEDIEPQSPDIAPLSICILTDNQLQTMCGVPSIATLNNLTLLLSGSYPESPTTMSLQDRLILTTMKLKLNIPFPALSAMFSIEQSTCQYIFHDTVRKLSQNFRSLAQKTPFRDFPQDLRDLCTISNNIMVVDAMEFRIERPEYSRGRLPAHAQYESDATMKFMMGFRTSGILVFISGGYESPAAERSILEEGHIINLLRECDAVMIREGWDIRDVCESRGFTLVRSPFWEHGGHLTDSEAFHNLFVAATADQVESVKRMIREFAILESCIPWSAGDLEDVVNVCAGIVNMGTPGMESRLF